MVDKLLSEEIININGFKGNFNVRGIVFSDDYVNHSVIRFLLVLNIVESEINNNRKGKEE